jgi:hypothetical protein
MVSQGQLFLAAYDRLEHLKAVSELKVSFSAS